MARSRPYKDPLATARALHRPGRHTDKWYAGITEDPQTRLAAHGVDPDRGEYGFAKCHNDDVARDAELVLHDAGYRGGPGGGSRRSKYLYVYKVTRDTRE